MQIYNYDHDGIFVKETKARPNPLEHGSFLLPARATNKKPPSFEETEEVYFAGEKWNKRLKKTKSPSKYHVWDEKKGWEISEEDQIRLNADIVKAEEAEAAAALVAIDEAKIYAEIRHIAVISLIAKGELPADFEE
jgi:hypothetical protein